MDIDDLIVCVGFLQQLRLVITTITITITRAVIELFRTVCVCRVPDRVNEKERKKKKKKMTV
jgi:2-phosphoglycerate kinase